MNYQTGYQGTSKKKTFLRILIVVASLAIVSAATVIYGNYLKAKSEASAQGASEGAGRPVDALSDSTTDLGNTNFSKSENVRSACVILSRLEETAGTDEGAEPTTFAENADTLLTEFSENGYTGITVVLYGSDGYLTYSSGAVSKYTHQKSAPLTSTENLRYITEKADELSLRTSAVIFTSNDFADNTISSDIEALCVSDAAAAGFDEIIAILPVASVNIDSTMSSSIINYIAKMSLGKGDSLFGAAFGDDVYRVPQLSPQIELFASGCDFLCIDLSYMFKDEKTAVEKVAGAVEELSGSFTVYGLRTVLDGSSKELSENAVKALADGGFSNYIFTDWYIEEKEEETTLAGDEIQNTDIAGDGEQNDVKAQDAVN